MIIKQVFYIELSGECFVSMEPYFQGYILFRIPGSWGMAATVWEGGGGCRAWERYFLKWKNVIGEISLQKGINPLKMHLFW